VRRFRPPVKSHTPPCINWKFRRVRAPRRPRLMTRDECRAIHAQLRTMSKISGSLPVFLISTSVRGGREALKLHYCEVLTRSFGICFTIAGRAR